MSGCPIYNESREATASEETEPPEQTSERIVVKNMNWLKYKIYSM